jgi:transcriptional regulator with XRE-family HTH domain
MLMAGRSMAWIKAARVATGKEPRAEANERLRDRLVRLRLERRLSQRALAMRIGRDHAIVARWESGEREPTLLDLAQVARVLRVPLDDLLTDVAVEGPGRARSSRAHAKGARDAIGRNLRTARLTRRLRLTAVSSGTGIRPRRLLAIESGVDPTLSELTDLLGLYGLKPSQMTSRPLSLDNYSDSARVAGSMGTTTAPLRSSHEASRQGA